MEEKKEEHLVLYRKHRPRHFDEVVGQEHVVGPIRSALQNGDTSHAYLFSGPRGVGKTTIARLIAKGLNCLAKSSKEKPCNSCQSCEEFNRGRALDLIEIDAASNRGIDDIRELRDAVRFVPSRGKYKTYVIDECHQLSKDAFNALLKTLEEPPSHAVFVLATTEFDKVPATIVSRTQHFSFRRPSTAQISGRLAQIAQKEGVKLDEDAARLIAFAAEGGLRDAEGILGQIMAVQDQEITASEVENILGLPRREAAKHMFELIANKDAARAIALVQDLYEGGQDLQYFSKLLMRYFRNALFLKTDPSLKKFLEMEMLPDEIEAVGAHTAAFSESELSRAVNVIFDNVQRFRKSPIPQLPLEITVLELINGDSARQTKFPLET